MRRFLVWCPSSESETDASEVRDYRDDWAAAEYAEKYCEDEPLDPQHTLEVHVRDMESGLLHVFDVGVDYEPTFYATERDS